MIERMARAAYEGNRARFNATLTADDKYPLQAWEDEPEALREDWRQFMRDALAAVPASCDSGSRAERQDPEEGLGPKDGRAASEGGIAQPQVLPYKTIYRDVV